ncbi:MAG: hypothetical protein ABFD16_09255 [Thermoguttaceae bacterium]|jgi:antitoxin ParD1/3/4
MALTIEVPLEVEVQIRASAARGDAEAVQRLLLQAATPTIEALLREEAAPLSDEEFEALADELAAGIAANRGPDAAPLSDYALSREGIYEDHP